MGNYLLVETRDPFDSADVAGMYDLADGLAENGDDVTVFLVQNGVLAARSASVAGTRVAQLASRSRVLADDFSLRERGIRDEELAKGIEPTSIDSLIDLAMEDGRKIIWH